MIWPDWSDNRPVRTYKSYKAEQWNKKMQKAQGLINSIEDSSLKKEDKHLLKGNIIDLFVKSTI